MVLVVLLDVEVDAAVRLVGIAVVENLLNESLLLDDVACGVWLDAWWQAAQRVHSFVEAVGVVLRYFHRLELFQSGFLGNLVLALVSIMLQVAYISNITYISHLITQVLQITEHEVESDSWTCMSQMRITIDGGTTDIHAYVRRVKGLEALLLPRQRIIYNKFRFQFCKL